MNKFLKQRTHFETLFRDLILELSDEKESQSSFEEPLRSKFLNIILNIQFYVYTIFATARFPHRIIVKCRKINAENAKRSGFTTTQY